VFPSRRGLVPAVRRFLDFLGEQVTEEGLSNSCRTRTPEREGREEIAKDAKELPK
jgi:hypothetical protein